MGNRGIITTAERGLGLYLHWNGGISSVEGFLAYCKLKRYRTPRECPDYAFARLAQVVGNFLGGTCSVGITPYRSDEDALALAWDNGVYIVGDWAVERHLLPYPDYVEEKSHGLLEMLHAIDAAQPADEQLGAFLDAQTAAAEALKVGDRVWVYDDLRRANGRYISGYTAANVQGIGKGTLAGTNVGGVPYVDLYCNACGDASRNINNYLLDPTYRLAE